MLRIMLKRYLVKGRVAGSQDNFISPEWRLNCKLGDLK